MDIDWLSSLVSARDVLDGDDLELINRLAKRELVQSSTSSNIIEEKTIVFFIEYMPPPEEEDVPDKEA
jgi:hypothetical protein